MADMTPPHHLPHLQWGAEALWKRLDPLLPGITVEVLARTDSTNTRLLDRARQASGQFGAMPTRPGGLDDLRSRGPRGRRLVDHQPGLLVAEHQTRGRGRHGRDWQGSAGASLTFSLSLALAPADWSGLSLAVGLALAEVLDPPGAGSPARLVLKWPNDLWLADADAPGGGRKLGGILIETVNVGEHRMCVIGIGLNVTPQAHSGLSHGYACLRELDPTTSAPSALARVAEPLVRAVLAFEREGLGAAGQAAWARRDILFGRAITTTSADCDSGIADGVDELGALRVRSADGGAAVRVVSGEVSVRLNPPSAA